MSLTINHNITSLNAWRNLSQTDRMTSRSMEKLSSGLRINRASDDPAGLVISEKMRAQLAGLSSAAKNVEKAINVVSTAEGALDKVNTLLGKMRSLAIDSANLGVNDQAMLTANQNELDEAIDSITRIANYTQFGTKKLLDGSLASSGGSQVVFQVGANESQAVYLNISSSKAEDLATGTISYTTSAGATGTVSGFTSLKDLRSGEALTNGVFATTAARTTSVSDDIAQAIAVIDKSIEEISSLRGKLGAVQSDNLEVNLDSLRVSYENLQAAESTIRDTDMTSEMATFTKYQIMMQAGTAMLAQANQLPNNVLQLLR